MKSNRRGAIDSRAKTLAKKNSKSNTLRHRIGQHIEKFTKHMAASIQLKIAMTTIPQFKGTQRQHFVSPILKIFITLNR